MLLLLNCFSCVQPCATPQMAAHPGSLSLGFSRQEYWSGLPFPPPMHACMLSHFSHVQLCVTVWTTAHRAPLSTGFSRQEYWSGLPFPSPGDLPNPGIESSQVSCIASRLFASWAIREALSIFLQAFFYVMCRKKGMERKGGNAEQESLTPGCLGSEATLLPLTGNWTPRGSHFWLH